MAKFHFNNFTAVKRVLLFCFMLSWINSFAQDELSYTKLLQSTSEIQFIDSTHIVAPLLQKTELDSNTTKKWFSRILPITNTNRLKNRDYYLSGKITGNFVFDLLLLTEEKSREDSSNIQVVYLVSTKKDGTYISSLEVAIAGVRNNAIFNTTCWIIKDNNIAIYTNIITNDKPYTDLTRYKINKSGRFVLSPNY